MLFHSIAQGKSFAPTGSTGSAGEPQIDISRTLLALAFLFMLILSSFVGRALDWMEGATAFLHLSEVVAGGLIGLFFGERLTLATLTVRKS